MDPTRQDALNVLRTLNRYSIVKDRRPGGESTCSRSSIPGRDALETEARPRSRENHVGGKELVELIGIEPTTSGLQNPRSPN
jgi:hypothetical protein